MENYGSSPVLEENNCK